MSHHSRSHTCFPTLHYAGCLAASVLAVAGWLSPVQALPHRINGSTIYNSPIQYPVHYPSSPDRSGHHYSGHYKPDHFRPGVRIIVNPISGVNPYPYGSSIIYGSPIPSPIPLNPATGLPVYSHPSEYDSSGYRGHYSPRYKVRWDYSPGYGVHSDSYWRSRTKYPVQVHPGIIHSPIHKRTIIYPRVIHIRHR